MSTLKLVPLWPTRLIERRLPGYANPTQALIELIHADEARETGYTVRYQEQDFFKREEAPVRWLRDEINGTVSGYLDHVGVAARARWEVEGWYNVNRLGDHHSPHGHPGCYLSGTYYVRIPTTVSDSVDVHSDAHSACISFHDPRSAANMHALSGEPDSQATFVLRPESGTLLMWPSQLQHYVHPNLSDEERITISFNIVLPDGGTTL